MSAIRIRTEIPGPRSQALLQRRQAAVPRGIAHATTVFALSAEGARVTDVDRNTFLDLAGGLGVMNVGHANQAVRAAIVHQAHQFTHTCFAVVPYEGYVSLAERLSALAPGRFPKKTMFVNSGAEAVENAVKIARYATGRPGILCFEDGFHGRTMMALALTSKVVPYKQGFGPFAADVHRVPYVYCYRCPVSNTYPSCELACVGSIETYFRRYVDPQTVAAMIVEPVLGEGGFVVPPPGYLTALVEMCRRHGILVIADEVQTGFGRTGRMFACEHDGIEPDLLVVAKSMAGGLPLGAVIGRAEIMDAPAVGGLGGTFGGNPVSLAAALAVLDQFESGELLRNSETIGARIEARAHLWRQAFVAVGDVRRRGGMVGIELVCDRGSRTPARQETERIIHAACQRGVLLMSAGTFGNVIRFLAPLTISIDELDEALDVVADCLAEILTERVSSVPATTRVADARAD